MKKFLLSLLIAMTAFTVGISAVEAKRMGGGSALGKQSQSLQRQAPAQQSQAAQASKAPNTSTAPGTPSSPWRNILGGALLGLGLGALLSHLGLSGTIASIISAVLMVVLLGLAAMFILRMLRRKSGHRDAMPAYAGNYGPNTPAVLGKHAHDIDAQRASFQTDAKAVRDTTAPMALPADFDMDGFLRHAKAYFIRLQVAWDRADARDIHEFVTPELFAELKVQLQQRGALSNHTDVIALEAQLLDIQIIGDEYFASVQFSGRIREASDVPPERFVEVWNLIKPISGQAGWVLAGIQQSE